MRVYLLSAVLALSVIAMPVGAQDESGTIYFTPKLISTSGYADCRDSHLYEFSEIEPAVDTVATGGAFGALACSVQWDYKAAYDQQLSGNLELHAEFGCDAPAPGNPAGTQLRIELYIAGTLTTTVNTSPGDCMDSLTVDASIASKDKMLLAGQALRIEFTTFYVNTYNDVEENLHLKIGPSTLSGVGLATPLAAEPEIPDAVPLVETLYENLTSLEVHHNFTNETTVNYVFNLTTFAPNGTLEAVVNGTGLVNATLADGNGTMIFNGTLGNGTVDLVGVETGNWTLTLVYEAFNGTVDIVYTQTVGGVPVEAADLDGSGDATVADEDAPGLPIVLLMVALVALARRRS